MWVLFVLVPLIMAVLTFVLQDRAGRWANGVLGVIIAGLWTFELVGPTAGATLLNASVIVAGLLVLWHALRWPVVHPVEAEREHLVVGCSTPAASPPAAHVRGAWNEAGRQQQA